MSRQTLFPGLGTTRVLGTLYPRKKLWQEVARGHCDGKMGDKGHLIHMLVLPTVPYVTWVPRAGS